MLPADGDRATVTAETRPHSAVGAITRGRPVSAAVAGATDRQVPVGGAVAAEVAAGAVVEDISAAVAEDDSGTRQDELPRD
jgi:hypothetical protein